MRSCALRLFAKYNVMRRYALRYIFLWVMRLYRTTVGKNTFTLATPGVKGAPYVLRIIEAGKPAFRLATPGAKGAPYALRIIEFRLPS